MSLGASLRAFDWSSLYRRATMLVVASTGATQRQWAAEVARRANVMFADARDPAALQRVYATQHQTVYARQLREQQSHNNNDPTARERQREADPHVGLALTPELLHTPEGRAWTQNHRCLDTLLLLCTTEASADWANQVDYVLLADQGIVLCTNPHLTPTNHAFAVGGP